MPKWPCVKPLEHHRTINVYLSAILFPTYQVRIVRIYQKLFLLLLLLFLLPPCQLWTLVGITGPQLAALDGSRPRRPQLPIHDRSGQPGPNGRSPDPIGHQVIQNICQNMSDRMLE